MLNGKNTWTLLHTSEASGFLTLSAGHRRAGAARAPGAAAERDARHRGRGGRREVGPREGGHERRDRRRLPDPRGAGDRGQGGRPTLRGPRCVFEPLLADQAVRRRSESKKMN